jgi:poly-gamma-glutamate synthesis protein (capsule biosynthesis protein)
MIPPPGPDDVNLAAVGDVMLDRGVADAIARNGLDSILPVVAAQLNAADIAFANLECPLAATGPHDPAKMIFRADPRTVEVFLQGGFDIVSLANNHALDAGEAALVETIDHLEDAGIKYVGAAREPARGSDPVFLDARGTRIGFLAYTDLDFYCDSQSRVDAGLTNLRAQVAAARDSCDLLVVSFHWGEQDSEVPTHRQADVARASIDAGADLILGHHPHVLQGAEVYKGRLILYSMGDFVFDARTSDEAESGIFEIYYRPGTGLELWMAPVRIASSRMGPEYPAAAERDRVLLRFAQLSAARNTSITIANGLGYLDCPFQSTRGIGASRLTPRRR